MNNIWISFRSVVGTTYIEPIRSMSMVENHTTENIRKFVINDKYVSEEVWNDVSTRLLGTINNDMNMHMIVCDK